MSIDEVKRLHFDDLPIIDHYYKYCGGYGEALREIGYEIEQCGFGTRFVCEDGYVVKSVPEMVIDNWLHSNCIEHELEPRYGDTRYRVDWLVDGVYVEFFGMMRRKKYRQNRLKKLSIAKEMNIEVVELFYDDLNSLDVKLGRFRR